MIDCFEMGMKCVAMLSLAAFKQHARGRDAENLEARLFSDLQMPSLGHFAGAARDCIAMLDHNEVSWSKCLRDVAAQATRDAIDELLSLRNDYRGHGATVDRTHARLLLNNFQPALIKFLLAIPRFPQLRLWRATDGRTLEPIGFELSAGNAASDPRPPAGLPAGPDQLLAEDTTTGAWLNLSPLLLAKRTLPDSVWQFLFYNCSTKGKVSFLDYGTGEHHHFPHDHVHALALAQNYPRPHVGPQWFASLIADKTRYFVGRTNALAKLSKFASSESKRTLIVIAPPGLGKTTLLARWAERESVLRHFLREGDEQSCVPATVFANLARQAAKSFGTTLRRAKDTDLRGWRDELFRVLDSVPIERAAPLVVLDGLDEAERVRSRNQWKESILDLLPEPAQMPGRSRWILSTRPDLLSENRFKQRFSADYAEHFELHRLDRSDVDEFLRTSGYWDVMQRYPHWAAEIVKLSEGSPLYLRLLVEELHAGTLTPGIVETLPKGLTAFFERTLQAIEEASLISDRQIIRAQKRNGANLLRRLAERGLITAETSTALVEEERQRLDAKMGTTGLEVLALFVVARAPLALLDIASILDASADELEQLIAPLRMVMVQAAEEQWTLFHRAFRDFVAASREPLIALAGDRMRKWSLRYREHGNLYALRHVVAHLTDSLIVAQDGMRPENELQALARVLTDLRFVELRVEQDETARLLEDYEQGLRFWPESSRSSFLSGLKSQISEPWQREAVTEVIKGESKLHLDRGSGPILIALRGRIDEEHPDPQTPLFDSAQEVPEEWFSTPELSAPVSPLKPSADARDFTTSSSIRTFHAFVSACSHWLAPGANVPAIAFNFSASGAVAEAAADMLRQCEPPWVERENRPVNLPGKIPVVRVLPSEQSLCVSLDFRRFVTFSAKEVRACDLRTGQELARLRCQRVHFSPSSSFTGDRVIAGSVIIDFIQKCVFELNAGGPVRATALTPDGRLAAIAVGDIDSENRDDHVSIWDLDARTKIRTLRQWDPEIHALAISADGRILAIAQHVGYLEIWDVARSKRLLSLHDGKSVRAVAITPDGRFAVCGGSSGVVWLVDVQEARVLRCFKVLSIEIKAVTVTPSGRTVAALDSSGLFYVWDTKTGQLSKTFPLSNCYDPLLISSDAAGAVVGNQILDLGAISAALANPPISVALDDDGSVAVLGLRDGSAVCEHFGTFRRTAVFRRIETDHDVKSETAEIIAVQLGVNGNDALIAYDNNEVYLVNIENGRFSQIVPKAAWMRLIADELPKKERDVARLRGEHLLPPKLRTKCQIPDVYPINCIALTPNAKVFITASDGEALRAWSVATGECTSQLSLARRDSFAEGEAKCLTPLPDSSGVLFTKFDGSLHFWRFADNNAAIMLRQSTVDGGPGAYTAMSTDGNEVVWAASWMSLEIRSIKTGDLIRSSQTKLGDISAVEWLSADVLLLAVATGSVDANEAALEIWDVITLTHVTSYPLTSRPVGIAKARQNDRFVCCTADGQLHWLRFHRGRSNAAIRLAPVV